MSSQRSRRQFVAALAATAAAPLIPSVALGQMAPSPSPSPAPSPSASSSPTPPPDPSSSAEALTEVVRIRWGKHLSGEQLSEVAKAIDRNLRSAERMKKVALKNSDEPDFMFVAKV